MKTSPLKWGGQLADLKNAVDRTGRYGVWDFVAGKHVFRTPGGAVLSWYPKTKTVRVQGTDRSLLNDIQAQIKSPRTSLQFDD
jgi:3'-phosphoadenosine 5'-phosphosulfate (PAPS) 3'-phosphatase